MYDFIHELLGTESRECCLLLQLEVAPWGVALSKITRMHVLLSVAHLDSQGQAWGTCLDDLDRFVRQQLTGAQWRCSDMLKATCEIRRDCVASGCLCSFPFLSDVVNGCL